MPDDTTDVLDSVLPDVLAEHGQAMAAHADRGLVPMIIQERQGGWSVHGKVLEELTPRMPGLPAAITHIRAQGKFAVVLVGPAGVRIMPVRAGLVAGDPN